MQFSLEVGGFVESTFGQAQKDDVCNKMQAQIPGPTVCTVSDVSTIQSTFPLSVRVNGFLFQQFFSSPTAQELAISGSFFSTLETQVLTNRTFFAPLTATSNCECKGPNTPITSYSGTAYSFEAPMGGALAGIPGPAYCSARLAFADAASINSVIGIDSGVLVAGNKGKFCSSPAIAGGVVGTPGTTPCNVYGVTNNIPGAQASFLTPVAAQFNPTSGALLYVSLDTTTANQNRGYPSAPTVSFPSPGTAATAVSTAFCDVTSAGVVSDNAGGSCDITAVAGAGFQASQLIPVTFTATAGAATCYLDPAQLPTAIGAAGTGAAGLLAGSQSLGTGITLTNCDITPTAIATTLTIGDRKSVV